MPLYVGKFNDNLSKLNTVLSKKDATTRLIYARLKAYFTSSVGVNPKRFLKAR